jgi:hypothetical protein
LASDLGIEAGVRSTAKRARSRCAVSGQTPGERAGTGLAPADLDHVARIALPLPFF